MAALAALPEHEIEAFQETLAQKLYALDTLSHWRTYGWRSNDGFLYARAWVVASGPTFYELVKNDPTALPAGSLESPEFEPLLYVARTAYVQQTGREFPGATGVSYETHSNKDAWLEP